MFAQKITTTTTATGQSKGQLANNNKQRVRQKEVEERKKQKGQQVGCRARSAWNWRGACHRYSCVVWAECRMSVWGAGGGGQVVGGCGR